MHITQKQQIKSLLTKFIEQYPSQAKAVAALRDVSEATVINIVKDKWDSISLDMWRRVGKQVGFSAKGTWNIVETSAMKDLTTLMELSREYSNVYAVAAPAGCGKTQSAEIFKQRNTNVFHVVCAEYFNRKVFLSKILQSMGEDNTGTVSEMMDTIVSKILKMESPLLILDEADKLNDQVLHFFITLYNMLQGHCGIILMATEYLKKRITRGRTYRKKGYEEIYSRIGRKFIALHETTDSEIRMICEANGIDNIQSIQEIINECEKDLRRVERAVHKLKVTDKNIRSKVA